SSLGSPANGGALRGARLARCRWHRRGRPGPDRGADRSCVAAARGGRPANARRPRRLLAWLLRATDRVAVVRATWSLSNRRRFILQGTTYLIERYTGVFMTATRFHRDRPARPNPQKKIREARRHLDLAGPLGRPVKLELRLLHVRAIAVAVATDE